MARTYTLNRGTRLINWVFRTLTRLGLGASYRQILTVRGRKTGRHHSTPVDVMEVICARWLVAGYGQVNWVRNAWAAGEVTLSRGRRKQKYRIAEASPTEAVRVLREYLAKVRVVRPYFDAAPDAPDKALEAELSGHPVFELVALDRLECLQPFVAWLRRLLADNNISPAKLTKYLNEASGGTSMVSRNEVCRDLAGHYLPEWSYVRSNYLGPIQEISQKFLAEEVIAKGRRLYAAAEKVTVPRVPKYRHRQDESFSRVMAPLLAGFSVPAIVVLATSNGLNSPWREIALAFLVMATGLFLASFQMVIGSVYIVRYDELRTTRYLISVLGIAFLDVALIVMVAAAIDNLWVFLPLLVLVLGSVVVPVVLRLKTHRD